MLTRLIALLSIVTALGLNTQALCDSLNRSVPSPTLPSSIRRLVSARHQFVPSSPVGCNIFRGHFYTRHRSDWAVLCADDTSAALFIFRAGCQDSSLLLPGQIQHRCPRHSLCDCGFTSMPRTSVQYFIDHALQDADPGTMPPPVTHALHDGIEESLGNGNSIIHYFHRGQWVTITGMD